MDKNFKIWGVSYGLLGDLIMGLPVLTYFEKKYPGSYKYWVIEKKCAYSAFLYFNQPLIDRIHITGTWTRFSEEDVEIAKACDVRTNIEHTYKHSRSDWWNYARQVEETAYLAKIFDLKDVLTEKEMYPKLHRWFDVGLDDNSMNAYKKTNDQDISIFEKSIAIWPFSTADHQGKRSPSVEWWRKITPMICELGYKVIHFGYPKDPDILIGSDSYVKLTHLPFFEQVKASLATTASIGLDSGGMWVMGAYSHPAIHLMSNWLPNHNRNYFCLEPINKNAITLFEKNGVDNIRQQVVVEKLEELIGKQ